MTASLAVAPQAFADEGSGSENQQSSLPALSSSIGEGSGDGSSIGEGSSDKQKKILGGVLGGLAGLALLAGIFNFLQSQGGNLPFKLPF